MWVIKEVSIDEDGDSSYKINEFIEGRKNCFVSKQEAIDFLLSSIVLPSDKFKWKVLSSMDQTLEGHDYFNEYDKIADEIIEEVIDSGSWVEEDGDINQLIVVQI